MAFDLGEQIGELVDVHPDALPLFTDASRVLFTMDIGPLGSDRGADGRSEYLEWREQNPGATLGTYLGSIAASADGAYDARAVAEGALQRHADADADDELDFDLLELYALDEAVIAATVVHLIATGSVDSDARAIVAIALARQAHPAVLERHFRSSVELRRHALAEVSALLEAAAPAPADRSPRPATPRQMAKLRGTRIHRARIRLDSTSAEAERKLAVMMDGAERPGGIWVSAVGKTHQVITDAFAWKLREAELELPGFEEIYFHPTTGLPPGSYEVEPGHPSTFFRSVSMGVDLAQFEAICRGKAIAAGLELFGGAVAALAEHLDLDRALVERVRADFRVHGLDFEVVVRRAVGDGYELRAVAGFRADRNHQLAVEHRSDEGARRAVVVPGGKAGFFVPVRLELAKGVIKVVPSKGQGLTQKIKLKGMPLVDGA